MYVKSFFIGALGKYVFFPSRHSPIKKKNFATKKYDLSFSSRFAHYDGASVGCLCKT